MIINLFHQLNYDSVAENYPKCCSKALGPHQMALIKFGRYNLTELWGKLQTHYNVDKRYRQQEIHRTIDDMRFTAGTDFRIFCG